MMRNSERGDDISVTAKWTHEIARNEFDKAGESFLKAGLYSEAKLAHLVGGGGEGAEQKIDEINSMF